MAKKLMTWAEWTETVRGESAKWPEDFTSRSRALLVAGEFEAAADAMADDYYAYVCAYASLK